MAEDLILIGNGGCMREIAWQLERLNRIEKKWNILGIVDNDDENSPRKYPYLGRDDSLLFRQEEVSAAICVGNPHLRRKIAERLSQNTNIKFPVIIMEGAKVAEDARLGKGCIICMDSIVSTETELGDFVFVNLGATVCHDSKIESFATLSPGTTLAGNVRVGENSELGLGAKVIQGIRIGRNAVIGAGAVVVREIPEGCTAVGVPARPLMKSNG